MGLIFAHAANPAWGQAYPVKPVRLIATGSPGGGGDTLARLLANTLSQRFGRQVIVDNRSGGASNIGPEIAAKAPPDGYTLFYATQSHAVNVTLYRNLAYDLMRDFAPVTQLVFDPAVLSVHPSLPVNSVSALVKFAKSNPGQLNYASGGLASFTFIATEIFKGRTGINLVHVPYKGGGPALTSILSGEVSVYFAPVAVGLPHLQKNKLRPLGVSTLQRLTLLPDLPTVAESGLPGYESSNWFGLLVPTGTPKEIISQIHAGVTGAMNQPDLNKKLADLAYVIVGSQPDEMEKYLKAEVDRLGKIVRSLKLTAD